MSAGPVKTTKIFQVLLAELKIAGPIRSKWPNFRKIKRARDCYHCHMQKGKPTYVAV